MTSTPLEIFVIVSLSMLGLILISYTMINKRISDKSAKAAADLIATERELKEQIAANKLEADEAIENIRQERVNDLKDFTHTLGEVNVTLGKFDTTLKHFDQTVVGIESRITKQIQELKQDIKEKQDKE
jgi:hypothetical protein